jgi:hypothetical protein
MERTTHCWIGIALVLFLSSASVVQGQVTAYINLPGAGGAGTQAYDGELGMDFIVNSAIAVTSLGAFDSGADGMFRDITTELWFRDDFGTPLDPIDDTGIVILDSRTFTNADPGVLIDSNRFKPLDVPLELPPGAYTIVARGYGAGEMNGNSGTGGPNPPFKRRDGGGGALSFVGTSRYNFPPAPGTFPTVVDTGPSNRYSAGTFQYELLEPPPPPPPPEPLPTQVCRAIDTTTQGSWIGRYGSEGYILPGFDGATGAVGGADRAALPGYVSSYAFPGALNYTWSALADGDSRAMQDPANPDHRVASTAFAGGSFDVTVEVNEPSEFTLGLYLLDYDSSTRRQNLELVGSALPPSLFSTEFYEGKWCLVDASAAPGSPAVMRISLTGGANAVVSAVTFDPIPEPSSGALAGLAAMALGGIAVRRRIRR